MNMYHWIGLGIGVLSVLVGAWFIFRRKRPKKSVLSRVEQAAKASAAAEQSAIEAHAMLRKAIALVSNARQNKKAADGIATLRKEQEAQIIADVNQSQEEDLDDLIARDNDRRNGN